MKRDQRYLFNVILDSITDGVFTVDEKGEITTFNRAAERITGYSREEAIGRYCFEIFRANICQSDCAIKSTLKTGKPIVQLRVNILNKKGEEVPISISTALLQDENGKVIGGVETFRDLSQVEELQKEITRRYSFQDIVSKNHRILEIFDLLPDMAASDSTVLIQGPSGSGKELFARAIHNLSPRRDGPYIKVNCGALPDQLLESELFGYVKGAFTDAKRDKPGRFALAQGGTIFLDEIGDTSPAVQVKLLRVLQEKEFEPLGATKTHLADVRVVAAANRDLLELVTKGRFRDDLYYRLNVIRIDLPPLSERREDIPLLIDHFIHTLNLRIGKNIAGVSDEVMELLMGYDYPGNVRELENILEHAFVLCKGETIEVQHLPRVVANGARRPIPQRAYQVSPLKSAEIETIRRTLQRHGGNRTKAAQELGIDRTTLWRKLKKYGPDAVA